MKDAIFIDKLSILFYREMRLISGLGQEIMISVLSPVRIETKFNRIKNLLEDIKEAADIMLLALKKTEASDSQLKFDLE